MKMKYNVTRKIPPIYFEIRKQFKDKSASWDGGVVIAYDGAIYCKTHIPPDIHEHEAVHLDRQKEIGAKEWWDKYLSDKKFRFVEEVLAYQAQAQFIKNTDIYNAKEKERILMKCAKDLSGPMYGKICTLDKAMDLLGIVV